MSELTSLSMADARDAEDRRLLEAGEFRALVESYYGVMIERCTLRLRSRDKGVDAAADVAVRLLSELKRGRRYGDLPFRVVVHQVIGWVCAGYEHRAKTDDQLPLVDPGVEDTLEFADADAFGSLLEGLTANDREVVFLRFGAGLELEQIAERLGIARNAVDQRLHRALKKIRKRLEES